MESVIEKCPETDASEEMEFEIEKQYVPGQCCPQLVKTGCRYNGHSVQAWREVEVRRGQLRHRVLRAGPERDEVQGSGGLLEELCPRLGV